MALALTGVFAMAAWLNLYNPDGSPLSMATQRKMGLSPCTLFATTGLPCRSCGMTTRFALLVRGDLRNPLRSNAAGTVHPLFCRTFIPWCLASVICKRTLFIHSSERALTSSLCCFSV
jgi:hypothetical protein